MLLLIEDHRYQRSVIDITNWLIVSQTTMEFFFSILRRLFLNELKGLIEKNKIIIF